MGISIGIVGLGAFGPGFIRPFKEHAHVDRVALCDLDSTKLARWAKQFEIANAFFAADAVINVAKMKAHAFQRITGAVKNPFGFVVGLQKGLMHGRYTNAYNFAEMLIDLDNYLNTIHHLS